MLKNSKEQMEMARRIGQWVQAGLNCREWSRETLARKIGLSLNGVHRICRGEVVPKMETLDKIIKVYRASKKKVIENLGLFY